MATKTVNITIGHTGGPETDTSVVTVEILPAGTVVERFDFLEYTAPANGNTYTDKFNYLEIQLQAVLTAPDARTFTVFGFHDGGSTWRLRFMPDMVGTWNYTTSWSGTASSGGTNPAGVSGQTFTCVDSGIFKGPLKRATDNPWYFEDARLQPFDTRAYGAHHMLWYTSKNIANPTDISAITGRLTTHLANRGYNFTMFNGCGHRSWQNNLVSISPETDYPRGWWGANANGASPSPGAAFDTTVFAGFEQIIRHMRDSTPCIYTIMFTTFWDQPSFSGTGTTPFAAMTQTHRERLIRYFMARLGVYFNMFGLSATWEWTDIHTEAVISSIMSFVRASDPYSRLLSVHDNSQDSFSAWLGFSMTQGDSDTLLEGNGRLVADDQTGSGNGGVDPLFRSWPIVGSEWTWITTGTGDPSGGYQASDPGWQHPNTADEMMRGCWGILLGGVIPLPDFWNGWQNFGGTPGGTGTSPLALDRGEVSVRAMYNFVYNETIYRQMVPNNGVLTAGGGERACMALVGTQYLVYSTVGAFTITLGTGPYTVTWLNPITGTLNTAAPNVAGGGSQAMTSPFGSVDSVCLFKKTTGSLSAPVNTALPVISGSPAVGNQLTCSTGTWTGNPTPTFTYAWLRNGATFGAPAVNTYTLVAADAAATQPAISCRVTATNSQSSAQATSTAVTVTSTQTITQITNALTPSWYHKLQSTTSVTGPNLTLVGSPQIAVTTIAQNDASGFSTGLDGSSMYFTGANLSTASQLSISMFFQPDVVTGKKHVLLTTGGGTVNGELSLEVDQGGIARAWSVDSGAQVIASASGVLVQGTAAHICYVRSSGTAPSQALYVNGVLVDSDATVRTWAAVPAATWHVGAWPSVLDPADGLVGHAAIFARALTLAEIQQMSSQTQSVAWAVPIDAGSIPANQVAAINLKSTGWHGREPITASVVSPASLGNAVQSGEGINYTAGAVAGNNDTFQARFTASVNGAISNIITVTIDVTAALVGLIANWKLDDLSGAAVDAIAGRNGIYTSPELNLNPLVTGSSGRSVGFNGSSSDVEIQHNSAFALPVYSIAAYFQLDSAPPTTGSNFVILSKHAVTNVPGGLSIEAYRDSDGFTKLRAYTISSTGGADFTGLSTGVVTLQLGVAHLVVLTVSSSGTKLYHSSAINPTISATVGSSATTTGLQNITEDPLVIGSYRGIAAWLDGVIDDVRLYNTELSLAQIQALPAPQTITHAVGGEFITTPEDPVNSGYPGGYAGPFGWQAGSTVTQNTVAFQAAVNRASANAGTSSTGRGVVELVPSKLYTVTGTRGDRRNPNGCVLINVPDVEIRTAGKPTGATRAIIKMANVFTGLPDTMNALCVIAIRVPAQNIKLSHITVDGSRNLINFAVFNPAGINGFLCDDDGLMHCIHIAGSNNVNLEWVEAKEGVVDGLTIDSYLPLQLPIDGRPVPTTFTATDCDFHHNRRQALSVVGFGNDMAYDRGYFLRCRFRNTGNSVSNLGQIPGYGVDVEPNAGPIRAWGLTFDSCFFTDNGPAGMHHRTTLSAGATHVRGFGFHTNAFDQSGAPQHYLKVINCLADGNDTFDDGDICIILNQNLARSSLGSPMTNVIISDNFCERGIYVEGFLNVAPHLLSTLTSAVFSNNEVGSTIIFRTFKTTGNSISGTGNIAPGGIIKNGIGVNTVS